MATFLSTGEYGRGLLLGLAAGDRSLTERDSLTPRPRSGSAEASVSRAVVGTTGTRAMLAAFAALGLDARSIRAEAGLADRDLDDPDALLPAARFYRMWDVAVRLWGRPALGLRAASCVPFGAYEVIDYLVLSSETVGRGLTDLVEYFAVMTHTARYQIDEGPGQVACEMVWRIPPRGVMHHLRDWSLSIVGSRVAYASGRRPDRVELSGPSLASERDYVRSFGAPVAQHAARSALVFSRETWETPLARRDDDLHRTLRRHAQMLLDRQPLGCRDTVAEQVRADLLRSARVGLPSMEDVADRLGMSARTLQRRLRTEGLSYEDLRQQVRASLAEAYLGDRGLNIGEIAYLLGFSGPSAFSRAFRRWTGQSPHAFRSRRTAP